MRGCWWPSTWCSAGCARVAIRSPTCATSPTSTTRSSVVPSRTARRSPASPAASLPPCTRTRPRSASSARTWNRVPPNTCRRCWIWWACWKRTATPTAVAMVTPSSGSGALPATAVWAASRSMTCVPASAWPWPPARKTRSTSCSGRLPSPRSRPRPAGRGRSERGARAGTWSARPCPPSCWAGSSTSTAVGPTCSSRTTRTRLPRAMLPISPRAARASCATGCTTASCRSMARRCPSRWATSSPSVTC